MLELGRTAAASLEEVNEILGKFAEALNSLDEKLDEIAANQTIIPDGSEVHPQGWGYTIEDRLDKLTDQNAPDKIRQAQLDQLLWFAWAQGWVTGIPMTKLPYPEPAPVST